jgi:hypothetical protein
MKKWPEKRGYGEYGLKEFTGDIDDETEYDGHIENPPFRGVDDPIE